MRTFIEWWKSQSRFYAFDFQSLHFSGPGEQELREFSKRVYDVGRRHGWKAREQWTGIRPDNKTRDMEITCLILDGMTLKAVGQKFGISGDRARQVMWKLLRGVGMYEMYPEGFPDIKVLRTDAWYLKNQLEIAYANRLRGGKFPRGKSVDGEKIMTYYILEANGCVYVKEGEFFKKQGGLTQEWGKGWRPVQAKSLPHARTMGVKK